MDTNMDTNMDINIRLADPTDLPILADLNRLTYLRETIAMFVFKNWPAPEGMTNFFTARMSDRFKHPDTRIFKAVTASTVRLVGFICWTLELESGEKGGFPEPVPDPTAVGAEAASAGLNVDFLVALTKPIEQMKTHMKGSKHYYVSTFVVHPDYQGKGIGSKLMSHCLDIADQDGLSTWLISFPGSHDLYLRFGFEDVDHVDEDLNAHDEYKNRGFGIYRSSCMVRHVPSFIIEAL